MSKRFRYPLLLAAIVVAGCKNRDTSQTAPAKPVAAAPDSQRTQTALEALQDVKNERIGGRFAELSTIDFAHTIKAAYTDSVFPGLAQAPHRATTDELKHLYEAANLAVFYSFDRTALDDLRGAVTELEKRGQATQEHIETVHSHLLMVRQFEEARAWANEHTDGHIDFPPTPNLREAPSLSGQTPTHLVVIGPSTIERQPVDVQRGVHVVVVANNDCHFSNDAALAIDQDPALQTALNDAIWIKPTGVALDLEGVVAWNKAHPWQHQTFAFNLYEWPMIDRWGTPTFYVLRDGVVVAKSVGWPQDGSGKDTLIAALQKGGLLP